MEGPIGIIVAEVVRKHGKRSTRYIDVRDPSKKKSAGYPRWYQVRICKTAEQPYIYYKGSKTFLTQLTTKGVSE